MVLSQVESICADRWTSAVRVTGEALSVHHGAQGHYTVDLEHPWASTHLTHVMMVAGGLAFCTHCGKRSSTAGTLHEECSGPAQHRSYADRVRNKLLAGVLPDVREATLWPNGEPVGAPQHPVVLVVRTASCTARPAAAVIDAVAFHRRRR